MANQECKRRPQITNIDGYDPTFFPFFIKESKCSSSCEIMKQDVSGTNDTRRIEWHEMCKCKCRFDHSVFNNKQCWNDHKCRYKGLIDKIVCDKEFIWNPSNCECQCYKSCDFSEFLDYKNCKCKKSLKLVKSSSAEESTENIEETRLIKITSDKNENKHKCSSYTLYIVFVFQNFFSIIVGTGSYFLYFHWYLKYWC